MQIGDTSINENELSIEEMTTVIDTLTHYRARKYKMASKYNKLENLVKGAREENLVFCSKHTGEIFNPSDWVVFDNETWATYPETKVGE